MRSGLLLVGVSRSVFGSAFRLHRNQLFYSVNFAVDEDDVRNFDGCRAATRDCRAEVTGAETKGRPEEIRAKLLKAQSVGVKALRPAADKVLFGHLRWPYAPVG